ncbi:MAG: hypothetical protein J6B25_08335 [Clostridia bacterium]|nr:hypothetical protein [Clostridia bacterium]
MDKEKLFSFIIALSVVFMLIGSTISVIGGLNENTAVKICCILIGSVISVLAVSGVILAMDIRNEK